MLQRIQKDGNCFYRSISHQLYNTQDKHKYIRECSIRFIKENRQDFEHFLTEDFEVYLKRQARQGKWADHVAIIPTARCLDLKIQVFENLMLSNTINESGLVEVNLLYKNRVHYDSIYDLENWLNPSLDLKIEKNDKKSKRSNGTAKKETYHNNLFKPKITTETKQFFTDSDNGTFTNNIRHIYGFEKEM